MERLRKKIQRYCSEYIGSVGWIKSLVTPALFGLIISNYFELRCSFLLGGITSDHEDRERSTGNLKQYIVFYIISYALRYLVNIFNAHFVATSMRAGFRNFFREYLEIKYSRFQEIGIGEAHYNIIRRANALGDFLTVLTMSFISNFFFFLFVLHSVNIYLSVAVKLKMVAMIAAFMIFSAVVQYFRSRVRMRANDGLQLNSRRLYDLLFNYERIVAYGTLDIETKKYWESMEYQTTNAKIYWTSYELMNMVNSAVFILVNFYLLRQFNRSPTLSPEEFKGFILIVTKLREKVIDLSKNIDELFTTFTNLDQSHIEGAPKDESSTGGLVTSFERCPDIEALDLSFCYGAKLIFRDVNCAITRGEKIAITGTNGNGKSTFLKILLGFYDYDGSLLVDGHELASIRRKELRRIMGYVPQNSQLFDSTVIENILAGSTTEISHEKVIEYCKRYGMHGDFKAIGYDKLVGERGKNLSGGQRQKVCFMRAVIRNTPVLLLDEATANMDTMAERNIVRNVLEHMRNKTVLMIIHNISLLKYFDRVLYFDKHTLYAQGTFEDLYKNHSGFREFYDATVRKEERSKGK